jgi:hypothetical protein
LGEKNVKTAIVTLNIGEKYSAIAELTHPTIKKYAEKIGADFIIIDKQEISKTTPQWEKYRLYFLLNTYDRIIYLDTDLLIRDDCPNLFDIIPEDRIGLFDESRFTDRKGLVKSMAESFGKDIKSYSKYYNTGVMVLSRQHKFLFVKPEDETNNFYEQTYFNYSLAIQKTRVKELDYKFNRMTCLDSFLGISRLDSFIIHYAGCPTLEVMESIIKKDILSWEKDKPDYKYKQRIYISVSGGLGDQINAQPAVRFMKEKVLPDAEIVVGTHYPKIFKSIPDIAIYNQGEFKPENDVPYCIMNSFPPPSSVTYSVVGNLLCHTVDYCSIALLKRTLPFSEKSIKLGVSLKDIQKVLEVTGIRDLRELVAIHPGKHWNSKTFPYQWWEKIIDGLLEKDIPVCIIGKTGNPVGVWDFKDKKGVLNLVDLLDLDALIALISQAKVLISNDSAPIHIAGAFDNWIIAIPTVKHPDHILPFRKGSVYYKTDVLYKKLVLDDYSTSPTELNEVAAAKIIDSWNNYLVEPKEAINIIEQRYRK